MKVTRIGVVGSGQIGPDIALYFSKVGHRQGIPVIVHDIAAQALEAGRDKVAKKIGKGVETGAFKPDEADSMIRNIAWSAEREALRGCDLVVEAATERLAVKQGIFADLETLCPDTAILASNSSHLEPERIFERARRPARCLVIHYFYPAERNPIVEIVPGRLTDPAVADFCMAWYERIGKIPIRVKSRYGYAIDPIFEGVFLAAALCVQEGIADTRQVDAIAQKALSLAVGPFTAMNLTGGNPITQAGLNEYHEKIMRWFKSPRILDDRIASGKPWDTPARGEKVEYSEAVYEKVSKRLMGAYFGIACEIVEAGLVGVGDLEMGVELALVMRPPFRFMNEVKGAELVRAYAREHAGFKVAKNVDTWWRIPFVLREDRGDGVAVLTIKRPRNLNALNAEVMSQLDEHLKRIRSDGSIKAAVVTGFGVKAFVSGADIDMIASARTAAEAVAISEQFQQTLLRLQNLGKPVVCAMNGLAFGGGLELALACSARVARPGVAPFAAQPEVKLGIIPGAGATQRLPRLIGLERAARMLRTGETISSDEAHRLGLVQKLTAGDLVGEAAALALNLASGKAAAPSMPRGPIDAPPELPPVELGGLSRKIDAILCRAILNGARLPLEQGLALETRLWAEVFETQDMKIGLENFKKTGLKSPAAFVHR